MLKRSNLEFLASEREYEHLELVIGRSPYMVDNLFHINQAETQKWIVYLLEPCHAHLHNLM